jgi:hypothetical protein
MKLAEEDTEESATKVNNLSELFNMILDFEKEELYGLNDEEISVKKGQLLGIFLEQCSLSSGILEVIIFDIVNFFSIYLLCMYIVYCFDLFILSVIWRNPFLTYQVLMRIRRRVQLRVPPCINSR